MCKCHPFQGGASVGLMDSNGGICQYLYNNRGKTRHGSIWHLQALQPGRRMDRTQKFFFFLLIFGFTWNEVSMFWSQYWGIWMHIELRYLKKKHRRWLMVFILFRSIQFVLNLYPFSHGHASGTWTYAASLWGIHFALMLLGGRVVICSRDPST